MLIKYYILFLKSKHFKRNLIRVLYQRQLKLPLLNNDFIFDDYKHWEKNSEKLAETEKLYQETNKRMEFFIEVESTFIQIMENIRETDNFYPFEELIFKIKETNQELCLSLFMRFLEEMPDSVELWKIYLDFIEKTYKSYHLLSKIFKRAVKCCWNDIDVIKKYLRVIQKDFEENPEEFDSNFLK